MTTDPADLHAVGRLLHLFPEVVSLGSGRLQVAGQSRRLVGLVIAENEETQLVESESASVFMSQSLLLFRNDTFLPPGKKNRLGNGAKNLPYAKYSM